MNQPYSSNQKSQNAKFIIVTTLVTLVILGIAVWGIVFVANYQNRGNNNVAHTDTPSNSSTADQSETSGSENNDSGSTEGAPVAAEGSANETPENNAENNQNSENPDNSAENTSGENSTPTETENSAASSCPPSCNISQNNQNDQNDQNNQAKPAGTVSDNTQTSPVPNTGPEDFLSVAILVGTFIAFLTSQNLVKRDII